MKLILLGKLPNLQGCSYKELMTLSGKQSNTVSQALCTKRLVISNQITSSQLDSQ